jgi:transcriptional regulator with XRE-family HTH domain
MPRKKKEDSSFGPRLVALRKARGLTEVSISYYENGDGVPHSSEVMVLARGLQVAADELLGLKPPPKAAPILSGDDPETRRLWKRFQVVTQLPEKDQRARIRLIHSLAAVAAPRRNAAHGEHNGR